jgi:hypothetical protein
MVIKLHVKMYLPINRLASLGPSLAGNRGFNIDMVIGCTLVQGLP